MKCTSLLIACYGYSEEMVRSLLEQGEDPNVGIVGTTENSPLLISSRGRPGFVKILLEFGADPNQADSWGETPLLAACGWNCIESVKLLVENGADIYHNYSPMLPEPVIDPIRATLRYCHSRRNQRVIIKFIKSKRCEFEAWLCNNIQLPEDMIKEIHSFL